MMPWSTASLLCAPIDATHWTYLAEGGQNLLVRLDVAQLDRTPAAREQCAPFFLPDGGATLALRIRKRSRVQNNAVSTKDASVPEKAKRNQNQSETGSEAVDGESFRSVIVEPLLGGPANLPFVHRIPLSPSRQEGGKDGFLAELANKIEPQRPAKRKLMDEIDPDQDCVWAVEDLTAASGDGGSMLAFEIKPKWLYSPKADAGGTVSRYLKSRIDRDPSLSPESWQALYDPWDLFCSSPPGSSSPSSSAGAKQPLQRQRRAIAALLDEWSQTSAAGTNLKGGHMNNNLRVYLDGSPVEGNLASDRARLIAHLGLGSSAKQEDEWEGTVRIMARALEEGLQKEPEALERLREAQHLHGLGIRDVAQMWMRTFGVDVEPFVIPEHSDAAASTKEVLSTLLREGSVEELKAALDPITYATTTTDAPVATDDAQPSLSAITSLRKAIVAYSIGAVFKDCSIMLRVSTSSPSSIEASTQVQVMGKIKFIDLDPKPIGRMHKWFEDDCRIEETFAKWQERHRE